MQLSSLISDAQCCISQSSFCQHSCDFFRRSNIVHSRRYSTQFDFTKSGTSKKGTYSKINKTFGLRFFPKNKMNSNDFCLCPSNIAHNKYRYCTQKAIQKGAGNLGLFFLRIKDYPQNTQASE